MRFPRLCPGLASPVRSDSVSPGDLLGRPTCHRPRIPPSHDDRQTRSPPQRPSRFVWRLFPICRTLRKAEGMLLGKVRVASVPRLEALNRVEDWRIRRAKRDYTGREIAERPPAPSSTGPVPATAISTLPVRRLMPSCAMTVFLDPFWGHLSRPPAAVWTVPRLWSSARTGASSSALSTRMPCSATMGRRARPLATLLGRAAGASPGRRSSLSGPRRPFLNRRLSACLS